MLVYRVFVTSKESLTQTGVWTVQEWHAIVREREGPVSRSQVPIKSA